MNKLMPDNELNLLKKFVKSRQSAMYLNGFYENIETFKVYQKLGIVQDSEILNGTISIIFERDFIELLARILNKINNLKRSKKKVRGKIIKLLKCSKKIQL